LGSTPATSPATQTILFSSPVKDPVLLVNFTSADSTMNFGTLPISFLSSNNAQLSGDIVTFTGSTSSADDGFAAQIRGVFDASHPLTFTFSTLGTNPQQPGFDSVGFTVAAPPGTIIPEPPSLALLGLGAIALAGWRWQRKPFAC
jgi:hypothetical protein